MTDATSDDRPASGMGGETRVIAFLNQKGGVGKTTSTVNIGHAIAQTGRKVCLIDLDPQAHLSLHLGIDDDHGDGDAASGRRPTVYDVLVDPQCLAEAAIRREVRPNLDVLAAEVDLAGAESELAAMPDRQHRLPRKFAAIADRYDIVLIDCPPSLGLLTLNAMTLATEIFVPMQAHFLALQGVGRLLETVGMVSRSVNPGLRVTGIILCMHEAQTSLAKEIVADLDAFFHQAREQPVPWSTCRVLRPPIRRNIKVAESPSFGGSIFDYAPWCPGALDYRKLVQQLLKDWGMEPLAIRSGRRLGTALSTGSAVRGHESSGSDAARDERSASAPIIEVPPHTQAGPAHDGRMGDAQSAGNSPTQAG